MKRNRKLNALLSEMSLLETGIFTDYSPAIVKFPTCVVSIVEVDSAGAVWFILRKPFEDISGLETFFYGKLELFNRSFPFYIIAQGNVVMHYDKGSVPEKIARVMNDEKGVAIAFHVVEARRTSTKKKPKNMMTILTGLFNYLFLA